MRINSVEELKKESYHLFHLLTGKGVDLKLSAVREMVSKMAGFTSYNSAINSLQQQGSVGHIIVHEDKAVLCVRNDVVEKKHDQTPIGIQQVIEELKKQAREVFYREDVEVHFRASHLKDGWTTPLKTDVYRTLFIVEVMTNGPCPDYDSLTSMGHDSIDGETSARWWEARSERIATREELDFLAGRQGSDSDFFLGFNDDDDEE